MRLLVSIRIVTKPASRSSFSLRPDPLIEVDGWLLPYRRRWADRLDALEQFLDTSDGLDRPEPLKKATPT